MHTRPPVNHGVQDHTHTWKALSSRGSYKCGSVITVVLDGSSLYDHVQKFFLIDDDDYCGYHSVTWFGVPEYAFEIPLVVKCREEAPQILSDTYGCILKITQIDPSPVMVERQSGRVYCWMMRDTGYDTVRVKYSSTTHYLHFI